MPTILALALIMLLLSVVVAIACVRVTRRRNPYGYLGLVESHRVSRPDTTQEFER